jgi:hypothetical protein
MVLEISALEHPHEEVVEVADAGAGVAHHVAGAQDDGVEAALAGFPDDMLGHPLALAVAGS